MNFLLSLGSKEFARKLKCDLVLPPGDNSVNILF